MDWQVAEKLKARNLSQLRQVVQASFALFCLYAGYRFYLFYLWAIGETGVYISRPPSVEAFLPISALMSLKKFVYSGKYDVVHPAGLTIFLAALTVSLLFRKGFCGWICPVGFLSNRIAEISSRLQLLFRTPWWVDYPLLTLKYFLLAFFGYIILLKMSIASIDGFIRSPYNLVVDAKMLLFFLTPSNTTVGVLAFLLIASFVVRNFWCRFLCPYGALLGFCGLASPVQVSRDAETCIDCKKCEKVCPGSIRVTEKKNVRTAECIGCLECVAVCPVNDCLCVSLYGKRKLHPYLLPILIVALFLLFWLVAHATGHWESTVPPEKFQKLYKMVFSIKH